MYKILIIILIVYTGLIAGEEWTRIVDLRGQWKFNLGDNMKWANPDYDDRDWENIFVPAQWEDEGFPGYDGYAWYRVSFTIGNEYKSYNNIFLRLWQIDDVDEVYINGNFIGFSGTFPPNYETAYNVDRIYRIPVEHLNFNTKNIIAVRVYDSQLGGGIVRGRIGIYLRTNGFEPDIPLDGAWKFKVGDELRWKEYDYHDDQWSNILVPAHWEIQGYKDYDGYAWYRKKVYIPDKYYNSDLILFLGKIDDADKVYFNGVLVGETGSMPQAGYYNFDQNAWLEWRAYRLRPKDINYNSQNVIAVRVFDDRIHGGIYQGPIGIITRDKFEKLRIEKNIKKKSFFEIIFDE